MDDIIQYLEIVESIGDNSPAWFIIYGIILDYDVIWSRAAGYRAGHNAIAIEHRIARVQFLCLSLREGVFRSITFDGEALDIDVGGLNIDGIPGSWERYRCCPGASFEVMVLEAGRTW